MRRVIVRVKGGIGNQLFCYAAARRLALVNDAELVIDDVTGFVRDHRYQRQYMLDHFSIPVRKATPAERLEPFERYRRGILKWLSRRKPFTERCYLEQEGMGLDERLLGLKVQGTIYLDGYWQSEDYFKDVKQTIREDLRIIPPSDSSNVQLAQKICASPAVALHVRWFDTSDNNLSASYYRRALRFIEERVESPHYFLFSDAPNSAQAKIALPERSMTIVSHNKGDENAYADLWLMTQCRHFIIANSTFSWWGAWLGKSENKYVVAPDLNIAGKTVRDFRAFIPKRWITL